MTSAAFSVLLGMASIATAAIFAGMFIVITGLRSMAQDGLRSEDRRLIGRYMLIGMTAVMVMAGTLAVMQYRSETSQATEPTASKAPAKVASKAY